MWIIFERTWKVTNSCSLWRSLQIGLGLCKSFDMNINQHEELIKGKPWIEEWVMIQDNIHSVANERERKENGKEIYKEKFLFRALKTRLLHYMQEYNKKLLMTTDDWKPSMFISYFQLIWVGKKYANGQVYLRLLSKICHNAISKANKVDDGESTTSLKCMGMNASQLQIPLNAVWSFASTAKDTKREDLEMSVEEKKLSRTFYFATEIHHLSSRLHSFFQKWFK